jgi:hypothetical protein
VVLWMLVLIGTGILFLTGVIIQHRFVVKR